MRSQHSQEQELVPMLDGHTVHDEDKTPPTCGKKVIKLTQEQWEQHINPAILATERSLLVSLIAFACSPSTFYNIAKWMYEEIPVEASGIVFGFMGSIGIELRRPQREYKDGEEKPNRKYEITTTILASALAAFAAYYMQLYLIPEIPIPVPSITDLEKLVNEKAVVANVEKVLTDCFRYFGNETAAIICSKRGLVPTNWTNLEADAEFGIHAGVEATGGATRNALRGFFVTGMLPYLLAAYPIKWAIEKTVDTVSKCRSSFFCCRKRSDTVLIEEENENNDYAQLTPNA